jgi:hypothetical protein
LIRCCAAVLMVCGVAATLVLADPEVALADKRCGNVKDVVATGVEDIPALRIRARRVSCREARRLPRKVILNARYGAINPQEYSKRALGIKKWHCDLGDYGERTVCHASRNRRVSWWLGEVGD